MSPEEHQQVGDDGVRAIMEDLKGTAASPAPTQTKNCPKLSEVLKEFIPSNNCSNPSTELKHKAIIAILIGLIDDKSVAEDVYGANKLTMRQLQIAIKNLDYGFDLEDTTYKNFRSRTELKSTPC